MKNTWNCLACACLVSASACAEDGSGKEEPVKAETGTGAPFISALSLGYGWAHNDTDIYRAAVRHDPGYQWLSNPTGWMSLYYEASMNLWKSGGDEIYAAAFSPVFIYYFGKPENKVRPYVEAGIGAAGISKTEMGNRQFSTGYQFEDRIGAGVQIENVDLCCRYMHYSNASIKEPNDGIDIVMVALGYRL